MSLLEKYITKSLICECCLKKIEFKIDRIQLEELKDRQLFNFVLMHADDHTLVISVDGRGEIRRSRVASLNSIEVQEENKQMQDKQNLEDDVVKSFNYNIIEKSDNLIDAFRSWVDNDQ